MKISLNELKKYADIDLPVDELAAKIGAQLGEVEAVIDLSQKYQGIIVAKVVSCVKHPNADKLSVCKINNGKNEVQVVCGAPNVREGLSVAWLPPGSTVPATYDKDPFTLEVREIRGQISNGMLASAHELGLSDDHSGILELDEGQPGDDFAKIFGLDDYIIDIENKMFTHRPDCFGLLGVAREISGIQQRQFSSPDWYMDYEAKTSALGSDELPLEVRNELPELVPRFMVQVIGGVSVKPSPLWLQIYLSKIGMKSINNVVDLTNYIMHLTGQPLHAYDYDKLAQRSGSLPIIMVRKPKKGEQLKVLGGKVIEPQPEAIMIATDKELVGIGGVIGGADTEVDNGTSNIILECASFDLYSIRRTSMTHGLFTDAVTRFSKGQSPLQNPAIIMQAIDQILKLAGGKIASQPIDNNNLDTEMQKSMSVNKPVELPVDFINDRLGLALSADAITGLLRHVEFVVEITRGNVLIVKAPFWRTDIEIAEDIVEEVGRLYGYDRLPIELPQRNIIPVGPEDMLELKAQLRDRLSRLGANEILTYSFVHGNLLEKSSQDKDQAFKISNALSPDLHYYRLSLTPSLLDKVHANIKAGHDKFAIFEIGKVHSKSEADDQGLPKEFGRLSLVFADKDTAGGAAYYQALAYLRQILKDKFTDLRLEILADCPLTNHKMFSQMIAPYDPQRSVVVYDSKSPLGIVGEFRQSVKNRLKLPVRSAGLEIFLNPLIKQTISSYLPLSRFPSMEQDICLSAGYDLPYAELAKSLADAVQARGPEDLVASISCIDIFSKDQTAKNTTFRIKAFSYDRTLTTDLINKMLEKVSSDLKTKLNADRV